MNEIMETKLRLNLIFFGLEFNITRVLRELRTLLKFNIFFLPAIAACYAATGYVVWNRLSANAEQDVMETARLMLETAQAMRPYTGGAASGPRAGESGAERSEYGASPGRPNAGGSAKSHAAAPCGQGTTDFANHASAACQQRASATK